MFYVPSEIMEQYQGRVEAAAAESPVTESPPSDPTPASPPSTPPSTVTPEDARLDRLDLPTKFEVNVDDPDPEPDREHDHLVRASLVIPVFGRKSADFAMLQRLLHWIHLERPEVEMYTRDDSEGVGVGVFQAPVLVTEPDPWAAVE